MAFLIPIFEQLKTKVIEEFPSVLYDSDTDVFMLRDPMNLGPSVARDIEGKLKRDTTPTRYMYIFSPKDFTAEMADAMHGSQRWDEEFDMYWVSPRVSGSSEVTIAELSVNAESILETLASKTTRDYMEKFRFFNSTGKNVGHTIHFHVLGPPDYLVETVNESIYPLGFRAVRYRLMLESIIMQDALDRKRY